MKDEIDISKCKTFEDVKDIIDTYINYYNNERPQLGLAKLTPNEYYKYCITGNYPY
ncbi:MAG: IS3 family transposase [Bacilli bacterium]|nr:IS3 family transposase [Bacilli bacterium]